MKTGGIELGGTKTVYGIKDEQGNMERHSIPTTDPDTVLTTIRDYFEEHGVDQVGIASFGPIDLISGIITTTPKPGWSNVNLKQYFGRWPVYIDTDVNGACLGEVRHGAGRGYDSVVYGTIGTGIGFGVYKNGTLLVAEGGHQLIARHHDDNVPSVCPYHNHCMEGLASGPAMEKHWRCKAEKITDPRAWQLEAYYLGQGIVNIAMMYFPQVVILGGGVMHHEGLIELVRQEAEKGINGYIHVPQIVLPALGDDAGLIGAFELAEGKK